MYRARRLAPWIAPARGKALFAPLKIIDNGCLLLRSGQVEAVGPNLRKPAGCREVDLGDCLLLPPFVNAHTHLQLSWLAGKTLWGEGFTPWLQSLVENLFASVSAPVRLAALEAACSQLAASGCVLVGDIGGSLPGALGEVHRLALGAGLEPVHFCEWFGFAPAGDSPWPARCRAEIAALVSSSAPAGHALYSTSPEIMQAAHNWCVRNGRKFSFHLAESPEETEALADGTGPLIEFYTPAVLPPKWRPPGLGPLKYALRLGLLGPETLAVHGVQLTEPELRILAATGAALCLCARSNRNLGVGTPPLHEAISAGVLLCLGTDGLTSCEDLDLHSEIRYLCEDLDLPLEAALRMATANGALALGQPASVAAFAPGGSGRFALWPDDWRSGRIPSGQIPPGLSTARGGADRRKG